MTGQKNRQVVLAHFSIRNATFVERAAAAHDAGFDGFGMYVGDWSLQRTAGRSDDELLAILAEHGTRVAEIEALPIFGDAHLDTFVHLVATYRPDRIQTIPPFAGAVDRAAAGEWLAKVADRIAPFGCSLAIEFLPFTDIGDAAAAAELVDRAGRPNVGLCVDSWHFTRSTNDLDHLRAIPGEKVVATQWNDGTVVAQEADYYTDCLANRVPPGDGEFALVEIVRILDAAGSRAPIGVELCSAELWAGPIDEAARVGAVAMRRVLAAARA